MNIQKIFIIIIIIFTVTGCEKYDDKVQQIGTKKNIEKTEPSIKTDAQLKISMRMPKTLNPLKNEDATVDAVLKLVFEPLFTIHTSDLKPIPNLVSEHTLSGDGKTLSLTLKNGLKWHDGELITPEDVIFSLDTIKNTPNTLYKNALYNVEGYYIKNGNIIIKYKEPYSFFAYNLCFPVIPKHYYKNLKENDKKNLYPIGSASFKMQEYRLATYLLLQKTKSFKGTPLIDKVKVVITPDKETDLAAFNSNIINSIYINFDDFGNTTDVREKKAVNVTSNNFEYLGFNFDKPIFKDINFRKAIAYMIPKDEIIKTIYLNSGIKSVAPINPNSFLGNGSQAQSYNYDIQKAVEMLGKVNIDKNSAKFSLLVNVENKERVEVAELLQKRCASVGVRLDVVKKPFNQYKTDLENGNFDLFLAGINFGILPNLESFLMSKGTGKGGLNYQNFKDAHMDRLVSNMYNAVSQEIFVKNSQAMQQYFLEQLPVVGIVFKNKILLTDHTVVGEKMPNMYNQFNNIEKWYIVDEKNG